MEKSFSEKTNDEHIKNKTIYEKWKTLLLDKKRKKYKIQNKSKGNVKKLQAKKM